ncbi:MAG TPA: hypothetical protein VKS22_05185 [Candidatus Binataceae bacterium]|nr:hypothetical protein [Candidatus Binataceae bacterium]
MLFLGSVREHLALVTLDRDEYFAALVACSTLGLTGGGIYDGLLGHCALKAEARSIYTWNVSDFRRLGPAIAARLKTPLGS